MERWLTDANVFISAKSARVLPVPGGPCISKQLHEPSDTEQSERALRYL